MTLKGKIQADHMPLNKYSLSFVGVVGSITFYEVSGLEEEVAAIEMPDRTFASGGQKGPTEITVKVPMHHAADMNAMNLWFAEGQDPVTPTYKKIGVLSYQSGQGREASWVLTGAWCQKRKTADLAFENDGEMAFVEFVVKIDDVTALPQT